MITVTGLRKSYGAQTLFTDVDLQLNPGNCFGIVGANGSGKSTLLRILSGEESEDGGRVMRQKRLHLGILKQDHFAYENTAIIDVVMMGNSVLWEAISEKERILDDSEQDFDLDRYTELEETITRLDGYSLESKAAEILAGLNIQDEVHRKPLSVLSGGYKLRALLGQTLCSEPDVLFLDEPTNHLDILSINWLEGFLQTFKGLAMVVSHDHRFLNTVCNNIMDVDYQAVTVYRGNYDSFINQKSMERERREKEITKREKEINVHKAFVNRFKAKATKARQANSRVKRISKIEIEALPQSSRRYPKFRFQQKRPSGKEVLRIKGIAKSYGDNHVLKDVAFTINRGEKVAIIGPNGIGKSTLLKIVMELIPSDGGTTEWGYETHVGYFAQDHRELLTNLKQDVKSSLWDDCPVASMGFVLGKLAEVLFSREDVEKRIENLSGGEAARLLIAKMAVRNPNVLVLDEPNNHLDLEGIEALVNGLIAFEGTILFVSHDRWLVDRLATRIIEITTEGIEDYQGRYSEYLERRNMDYLDEVMVLEKEKSKKRRKKRKK